MYNKVTMNIMKKLKIYLDTTIINFAIYDKDPEKKRITQLLIAEIKQGKYEAFISRIALFEIEEAQEEKRKELVEVVKDINPEELPVDEEVERLANRYIEEGIIPIKYADDARHIAVASIHDLDAIVSWNFEHIVKLKTKKEVTGINNLMGYKEIEIYSPQEVIENV